MDNILVYNYKSPVGEIIIGSFKEEICLCDWKYRKQRAKIDKRLTSFFKTTFLEKKSPTIELAISQLEDYFKGDLKTFDIPTVVAGTDFQKSVWQELMKIPYGKTKSYLDLSKQLNNVKAIRAVASANGANAISILIPCHRIIGADNSLVGYAGGLKAKEHLLKLEGSLHSDQLELF